MRGRIGWWRRVQQPNGTVLNLTEEESQAHILRLRALSRGISINADVLNTPEEVAKEKRRRLSLSKAFAEARSSGFRASLRKNPTVQMSALRIDHIAERVRESKWQEKPNTWIAKRLALELTTALKPELVPATGLSSNTLRLDVAKAKKLMGSHRPKN